tara:strand:- start:87 stop:761 length:675 start_codon:yes stop_codon:yes gene_type:complete
MKTEAPEKIPEYFEFLDRFEKTFKSLCVDYAFLEEFLSRENLLDVADPSAVQQAVNNIFWTYQDSLYLGVAKLADGTKSALSLKNFKKHHSSIERWTWPDYCDAFDDWRQDLPKWIKKTETKTLLLYRDESLAHDLAKGAGDKRTWNGPYKGFGGNADGLYLGKVGEILDTCKEGITLLARLIALCGCGRNSIDHFGFREAAKRDVDQENKKCRRYHGALLDLV